jgi:hypothetical protein
MLPKTICPLNTDGCETQASLLFSRFMLIGALLLVALLSGHNRKLSHPFMILALLFLAL